MSIQLVLCSNPVRLDAQIVTDSDSVQQLELSSRGERLSDHDNALEITLESATPVTVELPDIDDASGQWVLTATPGGNGNGDWERGTGRCHSTWQDTEGNEIQVVVTATKGTVELKKIFFVKVNPEGAKPW